jgi:DnaK suppressor protein
VDDVERAQRVAEQFLDGALRRTLHAMPQGVGGAVCANCGGNIPPARRAALPTAETCIACQEAVESRGRDGA